VGKRTGELKRNISEQNTEVSELKELLSVERAARTRVEEANRTLEEWKTRYEAAIQSSGQILYDRDVGSNGVTYGGNYKGVLGYSEQEMSGGLRRWEDLIHPDDCTAFRQQMARVISTLGPFHLEYRVRKKDGTYLTAKDDGYFISDHARNVVRMVGFVVDITNQRTAEQRLLQAHKMEAIGSLAGGVAHDFNNLLTIIKGYSDLSLEQLDRGSPLRPNIEAIREAAGRAAALTRQLLAFSRKQQVALRVLDLNSAVANMDRMLRRLIGEDIILVTQLNPNLTYVRADPVQIEQIILNLAVNARDAMPNGGNLTIETSNVELDEEYADKQLGMRPGPYVMLAVSDSGTGMDEETRAHIFEPFFTTKERDKGTGLGLSTVYGIVKQSGGHIWVYSEPGRGTSFKIYFPQVEAQLSPAEAPKAERSKGGSETVLLVEDEEGVRTLARKILERDGYCVLEACHGAEATSIAQQHHGKIDLMVTDVVMPGMSGRALAKSMAARWPNMKVLFLSGYTNDAIIRNGMLEPEMCFLQKPFTADALSKKVRDLLDAPGIKL
jgi:PAS domain S-box-containing protein